MTQSKYDKFSIEDRVNSINTEEDATNLLEHDEEFRKALSEFDVGEFLDKLYRNTVEDSEYSMDTFPALRLRAKLIAGITCSHLKPEDRNNMVTLLRETYSDYKESIPLNSSISSLSNQPELDRLCTTNSILGVLLYEAGIFDGDVLSDIITYLLQNEYADGLKCVFKEVLFPMAAHNKATADHVQNFKEEFFKIKSTDYDSYDDPELLSVLTELFS